MASKLFLFKNLAFIAIIVDVKGTGDDVDNLLDFMDEEKILDPFLSWLGWFTDMVVKGDDTSSEETVVRERNDVIKQALIPTLVNIIRHARMAEHGKRQTQKRIKNVTRVNGPFVQAQVSTNYST